MTYEDAKWLLDLCTETYTSTHHQALLVKAESFSDLDFQNWDAGEVEKKRYAGSPEGEQDTSLSDYVQAFASMQFRLKIMEIRHRLSSQFYKDEHTVLTHQLNESLAAARQVVTQGTNITNAFLDTLNIMGLNLKQILSQIAQKRIVQYQTLSAAAESLGIDVRTLKKYANY